MILAAHTYLLSSLNCCSSNPGSHLRPSLIICHYCLAYWSTKLIQQRLPTLYTILKGEESFYTVVIITMISRPYSTLYKKGLVYQIKRDIHPSLCKTRTNSEFIIAFSSICHGYAKDGLANSNRRCPIGQNNLGALPNIFKLKNYKNG